jgi:WD40 repeat protein
VRTAAGRLPHERAEQPPGFDEVLWSSLLNAPPLHEIVQGWLQTLSPQQLNLEGASLDQQLLLLLDLLRQRRILLVLDNLESILRHGERAGYYRPGYEEYGRLLAYLAEHEHQSCLLITSREEPHNLKQLELGVAAIRSLRLQGLTREAGQAMMQGFEVSGSPQALHRLVERYSGNPLALKLVAATVREFFSGSAEHFLAEETLVFDDIRDVLDQHYVRLSPLEQAIMHWLAVEREPVGFAALHENLVQAPLRRDVIEALRSLQRRSLLEHFGDQFGLQNVILEYISDRLIEAFCAELLTFSEWTLSRRAPDEPSTSQSLVAEFKPLLTDSYLNSYALVKAQSKEYVRESQVRVLLQPVAQWLAGRWSREIIAVQLQGLLQAARWASSLAPGYLAANLFHLLMQLQIDLRGYDFSHLALWQADLRWANLAAVDFTGARFANAAFLEPFETITALAFTPDGQSLVTGAYNGEICFWRLADWQPVRLCQGHSGPVVALTFHPDGQTLASGSRDCTIRLWDAATGELNQVLRESSGLVIDIAFDQEGKTLTSLARDSVARVWAYHPQARPFERAQLQAVVPEIWQKAAIHPNGSLLVRMSNGTALQCINRHTGVVYDLGQIHTDHVFALTFSPDGKTLASGSIDQTIRLWAFDPEAPSVRLRHLLAGSSDRFLTLAFSPDGNTLACGMNGSITLWDVQTGQPYQQLVGHTAKIQSLAFSPDGHTLVSGSFDQTMRLWDVHSGQVIGTLHGYTHWIHHVQDSPDGRTLASSHFDHSIRLWNLMTQSAHTLRGHRDMVRVLAFSPTGNLLATGGDDTTVRLWDVQTGTQQHIIRGHSRLVRTLAFHPGGKVLVTGSHDHTVQCWDPDSGEHLATLDGHTNEVMAVAFRPAGDLLATGSSDKTIRLWEIEIHQNPIRVRAQLCAVLHGHGGSVQQVAFHPNGRLLASGGDSVRLWDLERNQSCTILQELPPTVHDLAFSPNGAWLISMNADQTIRVWEVDGASGRCQHRYLLPSQLVSVAHFAFSPDNATLATVSVDLSLQLWDLHTGQLRPALQGQTDLVTGVRYSPDSRYLYSGSRDGAIRVWDVQSGVCLNTLRAETPYAGMKITGVTGITETQKAALKALGAIEV